jgi:hypothetical protein
VKEKDVKKEMRNGASLPSILPRENSSVKGIIVVNVEEGRRLGE